MVGRWFAPDPLADAYPSFSPYVYTLNNPLSYIDPDGMKVTGNKDSLQVLADEINKGLKESGVKNASVSVGSKPTEKKGLAGWFANSWLGKQLGVSTTTTEHLLVKEGEGWGKLAQGELTTGGQIEPDGSSLLDNVINQLGDMISSDTEIKLNMEAHVASGGRLDWDVLNLSSPSDPRLAAEGVNSYFGLVLHELVGHGHPGSPNTENTHPSAQYANRIGLMFGNRQRNDHFAKPGNPAGGWNGRNIIILP